MLELSSIRDEVVGPPGTGLSSERRKRLTIGVELAANPSLIFFDGKDTLGQTMMMLLVLIDHKGPSLVHAWGHDVKSPQVGSTPGLPTRWCVS